MSEIAEAQVGLVLKQVKSENEEVSASTKVDNSCWFRCFGVHPVDIYVLIEGERRNGHYYGPNLRRLESVFKQYPERTNEPYRRNLDIFNVLFCCQCSAYPQDEFRTPILAACDLRVYQSRELFQLLIKYGANVHHKDYDGNSAILRLVSSCGLQPESPDGMPRTAFIIDDLLGAGLDINSTNNYKRNVLHLLCTDTRPEVSVNAAGAAAAGGHYSRYVSKTTLNNDAREEYLRYFLDKGANVNAQDAAGKTPLHYCVESSHDNLVGLLLDRGADRGLKDSKGKTALDLAKDGKHHSSIRMLEAAEPKE
jgi:hypothetical protein